MQEIAQRLDLSYKAAESLLTRARQAFRDGFELLVPGHLDRQDRRRQRDPSADRAATTTRLPLPMHRVSNPHGPVRGRVGSGAGKPQQLCGRFFFVCHHPSDGNPGRLAHGDAAFDVASSSANAQHLAKHTGELHCLLLPVSYRNTAALLEPARTLPGRIEGVEQGDDGFARSQPRFDYGDVAFTPSGQETGGLPPASQSAGAQ